MTSDQPKPFRAVAGAMPAALTPRTGMILDHLQASPADQYRTAFDTEDAETAPTNDGDRENKTCSICNHFANDSETSTPTADFLVSAGECQGCSIILKALDAVTDIRRPEYTTVNIRRKEAGDDFHFLDPKNVLKVECRQEGEPCEAMFGFGRKYVDPRPNHYEIYTPADAGEDSDIPWLGLRNGERDRYREQSSKLDDRLNEARRWFEHCKADHPLCAPRGDEWPRRVLDLTADPIRLMNSSSITSTPPQQQQGYACLSYAWGTTGNLKTLANNLESHMQGIEIPTLPRTLADAVHVSKTFGLRYLWIDALCIIQDDLQDWMDQIPRMSSIYHGAELVISAQSASSVQEGFLSLGSAANAPLQRIEAPFRMPDGTSRTVKLSIREQEEQYWDNPAHHSSRPIVTSDVNIDDVLVPLTTRAWVFQENFLARRILFATPSELAWQCSMHEICECRKCPSDASIRPSDEISGYTHMPTLGQLLRAGDFCTADQPRFNEMVIWAEIVKRYSDKRLTKWTDRLAAIQGVVGGLQQAIPDKFKSEDYLFGLWKPQLEKWLLWSRHPGAPGDSELVATLKTMAPSWSWVTSVGKVEYYGSAISNPEAQTFTFVLRIEQGEPDPSATNIFGAGNCILTLVGFCLPVRPALQLEPENPEGRLEEHFLVPERYAAAEFGPSFIDMTPDNPTDKTVFNRVTHFAPITSCPPIDSENPRQRFEGLFLERVAGPEDEGEPFSWEHEGVTRNIKFEGTFRRVGFGYDMAGQMYLHWDGVEDYNSELRAFKLV